MSIIPIKPGQNGLTPHMMYCPRCRKETNGISVGHIQKATLDTGQVVYAQNTSNAKSKVRKAVVKALGLNAGESSLHWEELDDNERIPDDKPCDTCLTELQMFAQEVARGGVYLRCEACNLEGVAKAHTTIAAAVREKIGLPTPEPCGMSFQNCAEHKDAEAANDNVH